MGGIGKTTISRVVYERISCEFEFSFLLTNIRNAAEKYGILHLQKQLLSGIWMKKDDILDLHQGTTIIKRLLGNRKVLLILDDVNHSSHLQYLAGNRKWFGLGSRVLITTRNEHLLIEHGVKRRLKVEELNNEDSLQLFCWKAFKKHNPKKDFLGVSDFVVNYAKGLPLALEVLGSFLHGRDLSEWNSALSKLGRVCNLEIFDILKISYDGLDDEEKKIFLDIACYFCGEEKDRVTKVLTSFDVSATIGITVLAERSLLTISCGRLWMHGLLQEMGREIVRRESSDEPGRRSRLWLLEDIKHVLTKNTGTESIESIVLDSTKQGVNVDVNARSFLMMNKLRYLVIKNVKLSNGLEYLPDSLRILEWTGYPSKSLPSHFNPEKLLELNMCHSCIRNFPLGIEPLYNLKTIKLSGSLNLVCTPNFKAMPYLELLFLEGCTQLYRVDSSIEVLERLALLNLKDCKNLVHFASVHGLKSLKVFNLSGCSKLNKLPNNMDHLESLEELYVNGTGIRELPSSIGKIDRLQLLNLKDCRDLMFLPSSVCDLKSLKAVNFSGCSKLEKLPDELGHVECLEKLDVSGTGLRELPSSIALLKNLKELSLAGCKGQSSKSWNIIFHPLQLLLRRSHIPAGMSLPCLSGLHSLTKLNLSDCNLSEGEIPGDLGCLSLLTKLNLSRNQFVKLPLSICQLSRLEYLNLEYCQKLQTLSELPSHVRVKVSNCISLDTFSNPIEQCNALSAECYNCFKMVEKQRFKSVALSLLLRYFEEPTPKADRRYYCRFNFVSPGNQIPKWFNHQSVGSSIFVELRQGWFSSKWMGFALCAVFRLQKPLQPLLRMAIGCSLRLNGQRLSTSPIQRFGEKWGQPVSDHIWLFYVHRDRYFINKWQDIYSQLEFSFLSRYLKAGIDEEILQVKKCGVRLIYEKDVEELRQTLWKQSNVGIKNTKRGFQQSNASSSSTTGTVSDCIHQEGEEEPHTKRLKQLGAGPSRSTCIDDLEDQSLTPNHTETENGLVLL
ncbi:TMV resistance protein N-like [Rosa rugosa]|uniref:TMV resistance protein N-like n=1 Tax=Rosa rugosa TaxID=74645 RepID=UPI002B404706|nr:TMV resistance protein N-like [Rosa rugosa]